MSLLALAAVFASAPSAVAADGAPEAAAVSAAAPDQSSALSVYCFYVDPASVGTTQVYPGGKYCFPYPL